MIQIWCLTVKTRTTLWSGMKDLVATLDVLRALGLDLLRVAADVNVERGLGVVNDDGAVEDGRLVVRGEGPGRGRRVLDLRCKAGGGGQSCIQVCQQTCERVV